jgi:hypothetical protein
MNPAIPIISGGSGASAAVIMQAIRAPGVMVRIEPDEFLRILARQQEPLVVHGTGGILNTYYRYLNSYKGLAFFCETVNPLELPANCEIINARQIWAP